MSMNSVSIESLILANHVEAVNGLLYVSGGGWTTLTCQVASGGTLTPSHLGIALIVAVPWHQTNQDHKIDIEVRDEDAQSILSVTAQINAGRAPGMRPGTTQYPPIALPMILIFPHIGGYEIVARIKGIDGSERRWAFEVRSTQPLVAAA